MKRGEEKVKVNPTESKAVPLKAILNYFAQIGHIKQSTAKKAIEAARNELSTTHTAWAAELAHESRHWPPLTEEKLEQMVKQAMTKKYRERNSPMFSAADLCGVTMYGHRKKFNTRYTSVKHGKTCAWQIAKTAKKTRKNKSIRK